MIPYLKIFHFERKQGRKSQILTLARQIITYTRNEKFSIHEKSKYGNKNCLFLHYSPGLSK